MNNATFHSLARSSKIMRRMVVRHASSSKSMPFLPKPQNLSGLVGAEAEFDPLGFSDTFDAFQQRLALQIMRTMSSHNIFAYIVRTVLSWLVFFRLHHVHQESGLYFFRCKSIPTISLDTAKVKWLRESELKHGRVCP